MNNEVIATADLFRKREVSRLAYFHCDHFEPWRNVYGDVSPENAAHIRLFGDRTSRREDTRRLTLFYRPHIVPTMTAAPDAEFADAETPLGFIRPSDEKLRIASDGIGHLARQSSHEIQVHVHHEYVTGNELHCLRSKWGADFFRRINKPAMDERRFRLLLRLSLETIRQETSSPLEQWLFIHGNWALNAGDRHVCQIENEILLLQQHGCLGDFTFPAEAPDDHVNPGFTTPFTIQPLAAARCYDLPDAFPHPAHRARPAGKDGGQDFFIWSSPSDLPISLDYFLPAVARRCTDPIAWARDLAARSPVIERTLYLKTYAHSMNLRYTVDGSTCFPHEHPAIRSLFQHLWDAAEQAGITPEFLTAGEVRAEIQGHAENQS